ncbi:MerR family transcriptional regulator [Streptomyces sp. NPDC006333]|uniref:MerR family transcriptional regulator n=1 Tax=Streptomyces sp. NPDC006333 TaxID=3156753 RepID=UPI0033ABB0FD
MTADDSYGRLDDDDYPAYTMGRAAEMLGTTQGFLRALGEARLITPLRSAGGHRRYSRYQLRIAARARELVDQGTPVEAACRIVILEDQLEDAQRITPSTGTGLAPDPRFAVTRRPRRPSSDFRK